jgi:polysaccharide biosynthesis protein VpsQ
MLCLAGKQMKIALSRYGQVLLFLLFLFYVIVAADKGAIPPFIRAIYYFPHGDWVGHFVLYGILAWLAVRAFPRQIILGGWKFFLSALFVILMATIEELSQFWFPTRTPDFFDLSFGVLGTIVGTWLGVMMR